MQRPGADGRMPSGPVAALTHRLRAASAAAWLRPFVILLGLSLLGDLWATPARNLFPVYCEASLGREPHFASLIVSVRLLLAAIAAVIGGGLSDTLGQRRVFLLGLSGIPVLGLLYLTESPLALVALSVYIGFTGGAYYLGGETYMLATVPATVLGTASALLFTAQTLGGALGGLVAAEVVDGHGFAAFGGVHAVAAVVVLLLGAALLPAARGASPATAPAGGIPSYLGVLRRRPVLLLGALRFVPTVVYGTVTLLMPLLVYRAAGTASAAALYGTASLVFASLCQLAAGRLCDRVPRGRFAAVVTALMSATAMATAWATTNLVLLCVCGLLATGLAWALAVAVPGLVSEVASPDERGRALAVTHVSWYAGMVFGTEAAGLLVSLGNGPPFLVAGAFNLLAVAAAVVLSRDVSRSRRLAEAGERRDGQ